MLGELTCFSYDLLVFQSDDTSNVNPKDGFEKKKKKTDMGLSNTTSL